MSQENAAMKCDNCAKVIRFPQEKIGRAAKCPNCGELLKLRDMRKSPSPTARQLTAAKPRPVVIDRPPASHPVPTVVDRTPIHTIEPAASSTATTAEAPQVVVQVNNVIASGHHGSAAQGTPTRTTAAMFALLFFGAAGSHKFYLGQTNAGIVMAATTATAVAGSCLLFPLALLLVTATIACVEGVIFLTKSDEQFHQDYIVNKKQWF